MTKVLNLIELEKIEMKDLKSGADCVWDPSGCKCACAYADSGGSSPFNNWQANNEDGLVSPQCQS